MWVGLLGPLEVRAGGPPGEPWTGVPVPVAGGRLRTLLARLAVEAPRSVSTGELVASVWPDAPPQDPANALQTLVSRLRRTLGDPARVRQDAAGYRLVLERDELDLLQVADLQARAQERVRAGDLEGAQDALGRARALWRGEPLVDVGADDHLAGQVARWESTHLVVVKAHAELALRLGRAGSVVDEVTAWGEGRPLDEGLAALALRLLAATGRTPEALLTYEQFRRRLRDELGSDPSAELRALHLTLLSSDPDPAARPGPTAAGRSNLRAWLTSFVGREGELDRVLGSLSTARLTTIVGPGGSGKTRLAQEAAARWLAAGGESAWLVELAPVTDEGNIASAVLGALGLRDARVLDRADRPVQDSLDRLVDVLSEQRCLLVVDNCEHLVEATARVVDRILARAPGVRVLATSREPLALTGEVLSPLAPLELPPPTARPSGADALRVTDYPAVRLWLDRARAARPGFVLDASTRGPVVEIVRRLDGLPLAIELAAARLRVLPVADIAARLSDRFRLLTGGNRTSLPRHRTLRAVVEWSWDLLTPDERLLAERLAVFPAGADGASARAVCGDGRLGGDLVEDLLLSLVDKSLLQTTEGAGGAGALRFRMLETIREYGVERLAERGELEPVRVAHARFFSDLAVGLEPVLRGRDQLAALARLDLERENILSALRFLGDSGRGAAALHLALALVWYWFLLDSAGECATWLRFAVAADAGTDRDHPERVHARACLVLAEMSSTMDADGAEAPDPDGPDDWASRRELMLTAAQEVATVPAPPFPGIEALQPVLALFAGRPDLAETLTARSLAGSDDPWLHAALLSSRAGYAENDGDLALMRSSATAAYEIFASVGDRWGLSSTLVARARLSTLEGRTQDAVADYEEAARYVLALGSAEDDLFIRIQLSDLYVRLGDLEQARAQLAQLAELQNDATRSRGGRERELFAGAGLAMLEWRTGDEASALGRLGALRVWLDAHQDDSPMRGHAAAILLGTSGTILAASGRTEEAAQDLVRAHAAAVGTRDMPVLAGVGRAVARLALAWDQPDAAAAILGAAARVLGSEDPGDPDVVELSARARSALGDAFETYYLAGRSLPRADAVARLDPCLLTPVQARAR